MSFWPVETDTAWTVLKPFDDQVWPTKFTNFIDFSKIALTFNIVEELIVSWNGSKGQIVLA